MAERKQLITKKSFNQKYKKAKREGKTVIEDTVKNYLTTEDGKRVVKTTHTLLHPVI